MGSKANQSHVREIDLPCLCALIRKAARVVTKQYDGYLRQCGLRITQYSMLVNIRLNPEITVSHLSNLLRMDQTTVTRNLKLLEKLSYISIARGQTDQRIRKITISDQGRAVLKETRSSWEAAQRNVIQSLGKQGARSLVDSLQRLIAPGGI